MNLAKKIVLDRWIDAKTKFIEAILQEYEYFKKNNEDERFQSSNKY